MAATTDGVALERSASVGSARERPFLPARFLGNPHLQTIVGGFLRVRRGPRVTRERLELPDGDFLDIDCALPERPLPGKPWALVLHGLEGSSRAPYVRGVARQLLGRGIEACLLNYRGCSGEPNRLPRSYHSGESHDVRSAMLPWVAEGYIVASRTLAGRFGSSQEGTGPPSLVISNAGGMSR